MQKQKNLLWFTSFLILSFVINIFNDLFIFKYSFKIIEVFFHEFSHFITAIFTGGTIEEFHLRLGSGHVLYGSRSFLSTFLTGLSGYIGASLFGFFILFSSYKHHNLILPIICFLPLITCFFASDFISFFALLFLSLFFGTLIFISKYNFVKLLLQFIGIFVMVSAIYSPTYLWYYSDTGDHILLSENTIIPSFIFIILWILFACSMLYISLKIILKEKNKENL